MQLNTKRNTGPKWYVPISERALPEDEQFAVKIRRLDFQERARLRDNAVEVSDEGKILAYRTISFTYEAASKVIDGWKNAKDEKGNPIKFDSSDRHGMFDLLPEDVQDELANVFATGRFDAETEAKLVERAAERAKKEAAEAADDSSDDSGDESEEE
jgi:hypothetical protein